jgi:hypothetical protein
MVKKRNKLVNRQKLNNIIQGPEEPVQMFVANLKSMASTCLFSTKCTEAACGKNVDFSDDMVLYQLIRGLNDEEIKLKVLAKPEGSLTLVEKFIVNEESGKNTLQDSKATMAVNTISSYKKLQTPDKPPGHSGQL